MYINQSSTAKAVTSGEPAEPCAAHTRQKQPSQMISLGSPDSDIFVLLPLDWTVQRLLDLKNPHRKFRGGPSLSLVWCSDWRFVEDCQLNLWAGVNTCLSSGARLSQHCTLLSGWSQQNGVGIVVILL